MSVLAAVPLALAALSISAWGCSWCSLAGTLLAYGAGLLMRFDVRARKDPSTDA
jgi:hypothetical protein